MAIPHPIPYQGSKRHLAEKIAAFIPLNVERFIEPFAGSGALSLYMAHHHKVERFILNDINAPLIHLWDSILNNPNKLADLYTTLWHNQLGKERQYYNFVRTRFNKSHAPYYLLYLLARCVKASVRYNADGLFNQSPDNRRKGKHPETMRQDLQKTSELLSDKTTLYSQDYARVLQLATPNDLIYLDPPYAGLANKKTSRYIQTIDEKRFIQQLTWLTQKNISFILSYDGKTGTTNFQRHLPESLGLTHIELEAGRSTQQTLLGKNQITYESLYLSPVLSQKLLLQTIPSVLPRQLSLFEEIA
ncbi:MAG: Dam family site-specific DNA-(adenine-N6)-methyltransferase [bacterium]|nr:Dam family site-specific DNA-(adenine-N6)-methyltransferase [bacterium]